MKAKCLCPIQPLRRRGKFLLLMKELHREVGHLAGGLAGAMLFALFHSLFDSAGATVAGVLLLLIGIILLTGKALVPYIAELYPKMLASLITKFERKESKAPKKSNQQTLSRAARSKKSKSKEDKPEAGTDCYRHGREEVLSKPIISAFNERIEPASSNDEHAAVIEKEAEAQAPPAIDSETSDVPTYSGVSGEKGK